MSDYNILGRRVTSARPAVTVIGNCQAPVIARMLLESLSEWDIKPFQVHTGEINLNKAVYVQRITTSDIIVMQPIHDDFAGGREHCSSWVREAVKSSATMLSVPSLFYGADHPGQDYLSVAGQRISVDGKNPYLYATIGRFLLAGASQDDAFAWLTSPDAFSGEFMKFLIDFFIDEQKQREASDKIDVSITPFYEEFGGRCQLFHALNHPMRRTMCQVVNGLLLRLGLPANVSYEGPDYMAWLHMPILPSVRRYQEAMGNPIVPTWAAPANDRVNVQGEQVDHDVYLRRMIELIYSYPRNDMEQLLEGNWRQVKYFSDMYLRYHGRPIAAI